MSNTIHLLLNFNTQTFRKDIGYKELRFKQLQVSSHSEHSILICESVIDGSLCITHRVARGMHCSRVQQETKY